MHKERPLWDRLYQRPEYYELVRRVGYKGCRYRDLVKFIEELGKLYGKQRCESASYHCVIFEGQMTTNPKPLAEVKLRAEVRKLSHQLLGPDPDIPQTDLIADIHERAARPPREEPEEEKKPRAGKEKKRPALAKPKKAKNQTRVKA